MCSDLLFYNITKVFKTLYTYTEEYMLILLVRGSLTEYRQSIALQRTTYLVRRKLEHNVQIRESTYCSSVQNAQGQLKVDEACKCKQNGMFQGVHTIIIIITGFLPIFIF